MSDREVPIIISGIYPVLLMIVGANRLLSFALGAVAGAGIVYLVGVLNYQVIGATLFYVAYASIKERFIVVAAILGFVLSVLAKFLVEFGALRIDLWSPAEILNAKACNEVFSVCLYSVALCVLFFLALDKYMPKPTQPVTGKEGDAKDNENL